MIATDDQQRAVFPAYAGVNPWIAPVISALKCIPRVCGGEPDLNLHRSAARRYSPRMRG